MLSITHREFYTLIETGKIHPLQSRQRHARVPLVQVLALKAEFAHKSITLPWEKFIQAVTFFTSNAAEVNRHLTDLGYPRAPIDYIDRLRASAEHDPKLEIIKEKSIGEFFRTFGRADEILRRDDLRLLVELLAMINKGEAEIKDTVKAKYGREYGDADVLRFIEYFYNWKIMDPESVKFYFQYLQGRNLILKQCAYSRADYFIMYALGIDFGGEVSELLERSCLGLIHKLSIMIDAYVYNQTGPSQKELAHLVGIIESLLGAAASCRAGKVTKGKQNDFADKFVPTAVKRESFFETEKNTTFDAQPKPN